MDRAGISTSGLDAQAGSLESRRQADGRQLFPVPRDPAQLVFNAWSDGEEWTGKMPVDGKAYQHIQWIEILHGEANKDSCESLQH